MEYVRISARGSKISRLLEDLEIIQIQWLFGNWILCLQNLQFRYMWIVF